MRKTLIAGAMICSLTAQAAFAGNLAEPVMEPEIIVEESTGSSGGSMLVPILLLVLIAAAASSGGSEEIAISDSRLKTDIEKVGMADNGLTIYNFRYIGQSTMYQGVMAQDVLSHTPEAVVTMPGGYYAVNYGMLGLEMTVVD